MPRFYAKVRKSDYVVQLCVLTYIYIYIRQPLVGHQAVRNMFVAIEPYAFSQFILAYLQLCSLVVLCSIRAYMCIL